MNDILECCLIDRYNSLAHKKVGWYKKNGIDLVIKLYILLCNSLGRTKDTSSCRFLFIDEVKNSSMRNNLHNTCEVFERSGENCAFLRFYSFNRNGHFKIGLSPFLAIAIPMTLRLIPPVFTSAFFKKERLSKITELLLIYFRKYMDCVNPEVQLLIMSDHHFFSTIVAMIREENSAVIQHGLVMDKRFYYPIRAGHFFAWGSRSKELLNDDPKIVVAGTQKFSRIPKSNTFASSYKKLLFCVGSLDTKQVISKISVLHHIAQQENMELLVKCHPGSLFENDIYEKYFKATDIIFYKEQLLADIPFDLAISENSTVILDLIAMNKPFILYDSVNGYFERYMDIIPHGNSLEEISACIARCNTTDYESIINALQKEELNHGVCSILNYERAWFYGKE